MNDKVNPVIVVAVLFCNTQVHCPFEADPEPKNEILLFEYHPPLAPPAWFVPLQVLPVAVNVQLVGELPPDTAFPAVGEVNALKFSITAVALVILAWPWLYSRPVTKNKTDNTKIANAGFLKLVAMRKPA